MPEEGLMPLAPDRNKLWHFSVRKLCDWVPPSLSGNREEVSDDDNSDDGGDGESLAISIECSELECDGELFGMMLDGWGGSQLPDSKLTRFGFSVCCEFICSRGVGEGSWRKGKGRMQVLFEEVITVVGTDDDGTVRLLNVEDEVLEETIVFTSFVIALPVLFTPLASILDESV